MSLEDAQRTLDVWVEDYNNTRPHGSLADVPPAEYRAGGYCVPDLQRLENSLI
jgi:transposase InsO family protein